MFMYTDSKWKFLKKNKITLKCNKINVPFNSKIGYHVLRAEGTRSTSQEWYSDYGKHFFFPDKKYMTLVSNSHIPPALLTIGFFSSKHNCDSLFSHIILTINLAFPISSNLTSLLENFKCGSFYISDC